MQSAKFFSIILFLLLFAGLFSQYALSALTNKVIIQSGGYIYSGGDDVYAMSGSASDIQDAVNLIASIGGTVHVPAGTFHWNGETVTIPAGVNVIGASPAGCKGHDDSWESYSATTILIDDKPIPRNTNMFYVDGGDPGDSIYGRPSRISGIQFEAQAPANPATESQEHGEAIHIYKVQSFRVDHCTFINFACTAVGAGSGSGSSTTTSSYGVIDHCVLDNPYKLSGSGWTWGYGFYSSGNMKPEWNNWDSDITHFAGQYGQVAGSTIMYVEDSHIMRSRHAIDAIQGSWNVVRFNLIENGYPPWGDVDLHGSQSWYSGRGMEVYSNMIKGTTNIGGIGPQNLGGVRLRGGSAFVFDNTVVYTKNSPSQTVMVLDDFDYSTTFPFTNINQVYIWSNTGINCTALRVLQGTENVNYFLRAPNLAQDGFTYTPYTYPHPLTTQP